MAVLTGTKQFVMNDFSGGINTRAHPLAVEVSQSPNCLNVHSNVYKSLVKRKGRAQLNTTVTGASDKGNGLYWYGSSATTNFAVAAFQTALYKMDSLDGTWDSIQTGRNNALAHFENFNNTLIISDESNGTPQSWNGVAATTSNLGGTPPTATQFKSWRSRVYALGTVANPSRIDFSNVDSATTWSGTGTGNFTIITNDGDRCRAFGELRGSLYVFKKWSIARISYLGGSPLHSVRTVVTGVGTDSPETVRTVVTPKGEFLYFLGTNGRCYQFDGTSAVAISDAFDQDNTIALVSLGVINKSQISISHATVDEVNHWYLLFFPRGSSTTCDSGIAYDYYTGAAWPFDAMTFGASSLFELSTGVRAVYASNYAGRTYRLDTGNSDDGSNVNGLWDSARLSPYGTDMLTRFHHLDFTLKSIGNYDLAFSYRGDWNTSFTSSNAINMKGSTSVLGDNLPLTLGGKESVKVTRALGQFGGGIMANHIQIRLQSNTTNPAFRLDSITLTAESEKSGTQIGV